MKKLFTLVFVLLVSVSSLFSQLLPNGNMELWDNANKPTSWDASNIAIPPFVNYVVVFKETASPQSGSFSAKLLSKEYSTAGITRVVPSFITLGKFWFSINPQAGGFKGGIAFNGTPDSVMFYFKSTTLGSDKAVFLYQAWQGFPATVIAADTFMFPPNNTSWTKVVLPFTYFSAQTPDSLNMVFSASNLFSETDITDSSTLWIDNISLIYNDIDVMDISFNEHFNVYANESDIMISLSFEKFTQSKISIYNLAGQLMYTTQTQGSKTSLPVSKTLFEKGIYIIHVNTEDGKRFSQKIAVN